MKILHLISQRPDSTGSGIYLQAMLSQSALAGHQNYLVAGVQQEAIPRLEAIDQTNVSYVLFGSPHCPGQIVGMSDIMPYPSRKFRDLTTAGIQEYLERFKKPLVQAVRRFKPDIIHANHLWLLSALARTLFPHLPVAASCHGSELRQFHQCPHLRDFVRAGCHGLDAVLALSEAQRDEIARCYGMPPDKIAVTGAGYNESIFYPAETEDGRTGRFQILYGGKLSRAKGLPWLLAALGNLDHLDFHLHLAGGGSGREYEQCLASCSGLGNKATMHGVVSQPRLADLMRQSDLFVLPSLHEGLPLVILEALACGSAVLATALPGAREIERHLGDDRLTLVPAPKVIDLDTSELAAPERFVHQLESALAAAITQSSRRYRSAAVPDYFTWRHVFRRVETVWLDMLDSAG